jgi:septum site-determining protein MinC
MKKKQNVLIKGTKDGLTLFLNDQCSYEELKKELDKKLTAQYINQDDYPLITVRIDVGNRFLTDEQIEEIKQLVRHKKNLVVDDIVSNVMTKQEVQRILDEQEITSVVGIVRSGQVLEVPGDLLLIGDVNPGGTVVAGGNIYILGALKGIAHAGCSGNDEAVIAASVMKPSQLRINHCLNRAPDQYDENESHEMECAYIDDSYQIVIDRIKVLKQLRPNITKLKGGF